MDPNATLERMLTLANQQRLDEYESAELQELVLNLNEWIIAGGFFPRNWMPF
jgi:hypothetical protein